ncbi:hypothetical protein CCD87_08995 [Neisseria meningitidis]|nr:hypothetical protein CCD87_08995 [Neisseria meningitidis]
MRTGLDSHLCGNDDAEVARNSKKTKPNEPDSRFYGNDGILGCGNLSGKRKPLCRHSRAGGNLGRRI